MRVVFFNKNHNVLGNEPFDGMVTIRPTGNDLSVFGTVAVPPASAVCYVGTTRYELPGVPPTSVGEGVVVVPDELYDETWAQIQSDMDGEHDPSAINGRIETMQVELVTRFEAAS